MTHNEKQVVLNTINYVKMWWHPLCPFHGQRDCSVLLNGCSVPNKIMADLVQKLDELEKVIMDDG